MTDTVALHLLRHAHAGDPGAWQGDDARRPLSEKGIAQAERLGAHLAAVGVTFDVIVSSPKLRALQTAEILAAALGGSVVQDERLGFGADIPAVAAILAEHGDPRRPVLVGHDPDFSQLLTDLVGARELSMRKGALARIDTTSLRPGRGVLRWLLPPDLLAGKG